MVNPGKPSAGCFTCRKRRVKCDERKPYCFKCERTSNACEGYPDQTDLSFRNENEVARKNALLSSRSRVGRPDESNTITGLEIRYRSTSSVRGAQKQRTNNNFSSFPFNELGSPLDIDELVLYHLYNDVEVSRNCLLRISRDMRRIAAPSSPLLPVTKSLAWINAPTIHNIKTHLILARLEYAEAIAKLRKRLQSPASGAVNETLLVILLLSMTEPVLGDPVSVDLATLTHLIGASRFIESSKLCSSFSGFPAPIIAVLMNNMIFGCLSCLAERASLLCSTLQALHKISISTSSLPPGSAYIIRLGVSVVEIHNEVRLRQFSNWVDTSQNQLNILLEKCSATLKEISIWSHLWEPKAHNLSPDEWNQLLTVGSVWNRSEAPKDVSMWFRKDWSQLCLYQLILHVAACRCVQQLSRTIDASPGHAEEELRMLKVTNSKIKTALDNVAQEIKDFVPVFLGTNNRYMADGVLLRIAAYAMLMPLRVAITVPGLGAKFRAELEVAVELIANHAGISRNFITDRVQTTVFE